MKPKVHLASHPNLLEEPESIAEEHPEPQLVVLIIYNPWWGVELPSKHVQVVLKSTNFYGY